MLPDASAEHVDRDNRCDDNDDLRGRLGVLEAADAFVKRLTDSPRPQDAERQASPEFARLELEDTRQRILRRLHEIT